MLAELEQQAADAGCDHLVLVTGDQQPEAIALYRSAGYVDVDGFGFYADEEGAQFLGKALPAAAAVPDVPAESIP